MKRRRPPSQPQTLNLEPTTHFNSNQNQTRPQLQPHPHSHLQAQIPLQTYANKQQQPFTNQARPYRRNSTNNNNNNNNNNNTPSHPILIEQPGSAFPPLPSKSDANDDLPRIKNPTATNNSISGNTSANTNSNSNSRVSSTTDPSSLRDLKNVLRWRVPHESPERETRPGNGHTTADRPRSAPSSVRSSLMQSNEEKQSTTAPLISRTALRTPTSKPTKTGSASKHPPVAKRHWLYMFDNLTRAIDELYQTCEQDLSTSECVTVIQTLELYTSDFHRLSNKIQVITEFEETSKNDPSKSKPRSIAWEEAHIIQPPPRHAPSSSTTRPSTTTTTPHSNLSYAQVLSKNAQPNTASKPVLISPLRTPIASYTTPQIHTEKKTTTEVENSTEQNSTEKNSIEQVDSLFVENSALDNSTQESPDSTQTPLKVSDISPPFMTVNLVGKWGDEEDENNMSGTITPPNEEINLTSPTTPPRHLLISSKLTGSPEWKKRDPLEAKAISEERQAKAQQLREVMLEEKKKKASLAHHKVTSAHERQNQKLAQKGLMLEGRLERAEELHAKHISQTKKRALKENEKVNEVQYINQESTETMKFFNEKRQEETKARREELAREKQQKLAVLARKEEQVSQRRMQIQAARSAHLSQSKNAPCSDEKRGLRQICRYCNVDVSLETLESHIVTKKHKKLQQEAEKLAENSESRPKSSNSDGSQDSDCLITVPLDPVPVIMTAISIEEQNELKEMEKELKPNAKKLRSKIWSQLASQQPSESTLQETKLEVKQEETSKNGENSDKEDEDEEEILEKKIAYTETLPIVESPNRQKIFKSVEDINTALSKKSHSQTTATLKTLMKILTGVLEPDLAPPSQKSKKHPSKGKGKQVNSVNNSNNNNNNNNNNSIKNTLNTTTNNSNNNSNNNNNNNNNNITETDQHVVRQTGVIDLLLSIISNALHIDVSFTRDEVLSLCIEILLLSSTGLNPLNRQYILRTGLVLTLVDLLGLCLIEPGESALFLPNLLYLLTIVFNEMADINASLSSNASPRSPLTAPINQNASSQSPIKSVSSESPESVLKIEKIREDLLAYMSSLCLFDKMEQRLTHLHSTGDTQYASLILQRSLELLEVITRTVSNHVRDKPVYFSLIGNNTSPLLKEAELMAVFRRTDLLGIMTVLASVLLAGKPLRTSLTTSPKTQGTNTNTNTNTNTLSISPNSLTTLTIAYRAVKFLNNVALFDLPFLQSFLGSDDFQGEFFHILCHVLWFCTGNENNPIQPSGKLSARTPPVSNQFQERRVKLLHEVILLVGYYVLLNQRNQEILQWGNSPTPLQILCSLPFQYFSDNRHKAILFPTLVCLCYENPRNNSILNQEVSSTMLSMYLKSSSNLLTQTSTSIITQPPIVPPRFLLQNRFPIDLYPLAISFFEKFT